MVSGEGCLFCDADGNQYVDVLNNFTQQIHGHRHKDTQDAVRKQLEYGTIFGAPHELQYQLGELLCKRIPSVEKIRFCNSVTEATMIAIKGSRAYTKKNKIIKVEGMYHGTHDLAEISVFPPLSSAGDANAPNAILGNPGIPESILENVVVVPFNNISAFEAAVNKSKDDLAAVIMEPVMTSAGVIAADPEYLRFVRNLTADLGIVLIFDEVVTFRLGNGGGQETYGITPDITTLGKFIGGGFPIGAFGGKEEFMSVYAPDESTFAVSGNRVKHSGTFNGHPVIMSAGLASMNALTPATFENINNLGTLLQNKLNNEVFKPIGVRMQATCCGSLLYIHYTDGQLKNYRDAKIPVGMVGKLPHLIHMELLNNGVFVAERGEISISTPTNEDNIKQVAEAYLQVMEKIKPALKSDLPHLFTN
ncbi:MAG: aspartate aminotransferase family protein [Clostridiaceae bacterium]